MNQTTSNEDIYFKSNIKGLRYHLVDMTIGYLTYLLYNDEAKEAARKKHNFSVIQYVNIETLKAHIEVSTRIYNILARLPRSNTYLNFGMGAGFLERIVKLLGKINLESVEWEEQDVLFKPLREHLEVDVNYICNSIHDDNFEIYECNKTYDYIILTRFFPLNRAHSDLQQVKEILTKLKKYCDKAILIDYYANYDKDVVEYFNSICEEPLPKSQNFEHWVLDLTKV